MKNKEVYEYLNEIETDYEDIDLSEFEIRSLEKLVKANAKKKHRRLKIFASLAAAFVLSFGILLGANENVLAKVKAEVINLVEDFFTDKRVAFNESSDKPEEVQKYTVNLHETVTLDHMSFVVEDVIIDGKTGYLNVIFPEEYSSRFNEDYNQVYIINRIFINGKKYKMHSAGGGGAKKIGDGQVTETWDFVLEENMPSDEDLNLIIEFANFDNSYDSAAVEVNLTMADLNKDSMVYLEDFNIPNSDFTIKLMKINLLNPRIETIQPSKSKSDEFLRFIGKNQDGKTLVFHSHLGTKIGENFFTEFKFVEKGNDDYYEKVSDFTIKELNQLKGGFKFQLYSKKYEKNLFGEIKRDETGKAIFNESTIGDPFVVEFK